MVKLLILLQEMFWILMNTESPFSKECYCLFQIIIVSSGYDSLAAGLNVVQFGL